MLLPKNCCGCRKAVGGTGLLFLRVGGLINVDYISHPSTTIRIPVPLNQIKRLFRNPSIAMRPWARMHQTLMKSAS